MDTREFLTTILPPQGEYYVLGGVKGLTSSTAPDLNAAIRLINTRKANHQNVYISTSSHKPGTDRSADNVSYKKVFYLDIDCGDKKPYKEKKDALTALSTFLKTTRFRPPSILVSSGRGLHVYWVLSECITGDNWRATANRFKRYVADNGLDGDPAVTSDSARIMRVPGTTNYRGTSESECVVLKSFGYTYTADEFSAALPPAGDAELLPAQVTTPNNVVAMFPGSNGFEDMYATGDNVPRRLEHILPNCQTLRTIHETGGKDADFNLWFRTLNFLAFCEDGEDYVHHVSIEHPTYSEAETTRQWNAIKADRDSGKLTGSTTCESFHSCAPESCASCPHWKDRNENNWKSPIHFGTPQPATTGLPWPWQNLPQNSMGRLDKDGDVVDKITCRVTNVVALKTEDTTLVQFDFNDNGDIRKGIAVDTELFHDKKMLAKHLCRLNCVLHNHEVPIFGSLMTAWYRQLASAKSIRPALRQYGWVNFHDRRGFAVGDQVYWSDGTSDTTVAPDREMCRQFSPHGSLKEWQRLAGYALQAKHVETEIIMAAAFAAPLVTFTGESGCILSAISAESGTGKSLALKLSQSVWGSPHGMNSMNDTENAVSKKMGLSNNLPAYWDEIRIVDDREGARFINFIYQCTQGREKRRMQATTDLRESYEWCTMLVCAGNAGIQERMSFLDTHTNAGMLRVLEFNVDALDERTKYDQASSFSALQENFGTVGVEYAKWLAKYRSAAQKLTVGTRDKLTKKFNAKADERFLIASMATIMAGARIANLNGWVSFDEEAIKERLYKVFYEIREKVEEIQDKRLGERGPVQLLNAFMEDHRENLLITNRIAPGKERYEMKVEHLPANNKPVYARLGTLDNQIMISMRVWRDWLFNKKGGANSTQVDIEKLGVKVISARLLVGVHGINVNSRQRCLLIVKNEHTKTLFGED